METMGTYGWRADHSLEEWLFEEGYKFDFYQAVKLLELRQPQNLSVGEGVDPAFEAVRFKSTISLGFPATSIDAIDQEQGRAVMNVNFMGIAGHLGPLPDVYVELIIDRIRQKDTTLRDFLDIFNHRLVSLMYRIRKNYRIGFDPKPPESGNFAETLFSLIGMRTPGLRGRLKVPDLALLRYAGILSQKPRALSGLERILTDYFRVPVRARSFSGQWYRLEDDQTTEIGQRGRNQALGVSAVLGRHVWDQHGRFELYSDPLPLEEFMSFLPTGKKFAATLSLTEFYAGHEFDFDMCLKLRASAVPESRLSTTGSTRLGWTSWLNIGPAAHDGEVKLSPRFLAKLFLVVIWHNDLVIDEAMEKIPSSMLTALS